MESLSKNATKSKYFVRIFFTCTHSKKQPVDYRSRHHFARMRIVLYRARRSGRMPSEISAAPTPSLR
ncbi:hypothetical protein, partial [Rhizobium ruizarguesonis]|uniref:hypothetical protein n=1 Tax=Rhizobium ruizarguesonis TaxID=2081791 RepID=UPI001A8DCF3A